MAEIAAAGSAPIWFQLYWLQNDALVARLVAAAERADCTAIVLTVDTVRLGRRYRTLRNGYDIPLSALSAHVVEAAGGASLTPAEIRALTAFNPGLGWADVARLRELTHLPILLKGVLSPDDAASAVEAGVAGLVVSNHGGRQLDGGRGQPGRAARRRCGRRWPVPGLPRRRRAERRGASPNCSANWSVS